MRLVPRFGSEPRRTPLACILRLLARERYPFWRVGSFLVSFLTMFSGGAWTHKNALSSTAS